MKTLLTTTTFVLLLASVSFSQNISIADFIQLRANTSTSVASKLSSCHINYYDEDDIGNGKTQYTYKNDDVSNTSFQWVDFVYAQNAPWNNRLSFQVQNIELVKKYLTEMKDLGFYFTGKKIVDRQIYETYTDGNNTVELITSQSRKVYDNNMYFNFAFYAADEYKYAFATENKKYSLPQINESDLYAGLVGMPIEMQK